eukprot:2311718-Ditylum_brightwellii.AAC.1
MKTTSSHTATTRSANNNIRTKWVRVPCFKTHTCQLCATKLGLTELVYKDPITTEDEESDSNKEGNDKERERHSNCLIRKTVPSSNENETAPKNSPSRTQ